MNPAASLALATEKPKPDLMRESPYKRTEYIISRKLAKHIIGNSIY